MTYSPKRKMNFTYLIMKIGKTLIIGEVKSYFGVMYLGEGKQYDTSTLHMV